MSKLISIDPKCRKDPHYRYKMPVVELHYQGKNQNTRTFIDNIEAISRKLSRSTSSILKFMMISLKTRQDKGSLRGHHTIDSLQDILDQFISLYLLCPHCSSPETRLVLDTGKLEFDCRACGARKMVPDGNMQRILAKEAKIIKNTLTDISTIREEDIIWSSPLDEKSIEQRRKELTLNSENDKLVNLIKRKCTNETKFSRLIAKNKWDIQTTVNKILYGCFGWNLRKQLIETSPSLKIFPSEFKLEFLDQLADWVKYHYPEKWDKFKLDIFKVVNQFIVEKEVFDKWERGKELIPEFY